MAFNSLVQVAPNGQWSPDFRARANLVREKLGLSLNSFGTELGFSGGFVHGLLAGKETHRMADKHADRVLDALERLEVRAGIRAPGKTIAAAENGSGAIDPADLGAMIKAINAMGFSVELKPIAS